MISAHTRWLRRGGGAFGVFCALAMVMIGGSDARATWSIILIDTETKEIAEGSATCLTSFDLQRVLPVMLVGVGAGAAQSFIDSTGQNRLLIRDELLLGTDPETILELLDAQDAGHQTRQYGIVDRMGRSTTFTGTQAADWADGVVGLSGTMAYAIQGNILTGEPVVAMALDAVLSTPGGLPEKLMAGMEAARSMGGDGRCSCSAVDPTSCGSPPADFTKAAHIGFMIDARLGDTDGGCEIEQGCASGDYYMDFNVAFQTVGDEDPVLQMQALFDAWRAGLIARPDAVRSTAVVDPPSVPGNGAATAEMVITLRDWQGTPVAPGSVVLTVHHAPDSAGLSSIGPVTDSGDGTFSVTLTAGQGAGTDRFWVVADDGVRPMTLMPPPELALAPLGDANGDGDWDLFDVIEFVACVTAPTGSAEVGGVDCALFDFEVDGDVDLIDFGRMQALFTGSCAEIVTQPMSQTSCPTQPVVFAIEVSRPDVAYQWFKDGAAIDGATSAEYAIASADESDEGVYAARVVDFCGELISADAVLDVVDLPVFTTLPQDVSVCLGEAAEICSVADGLEPLSFQWFKDGVAIDGATSMCITIPALSSSDVGGYTVVVTDGCGSAVESPPAIVSAADVMFALQPEDQEVCVGDTITLFVVAQNAATFQWTKDGVDVPGADAPFYFKPDATTDDTGVYTCVAGNACGSVESNEAVLIVMNCASP